MKKKTLAWLFVLVCIGCLVLYVVMRSNDKNLSLSSPTETQLINTQDIITVSMDKHTIWGSSIGQVYRTYVFKNKTEETINVMLPAWLEKSVDGVWYKVCEPPKSNDVADIEPVWRIPARTVTKYAADLFSCWDDKLNPGTYRWVWLAHFAQEEHAIIEESSFCVAVEFRVVF